MYTVTFHNGRTVESYDTPGVSPAEMARYALAYADVRPDDYETFAEFERAMADANTFATFCITQTLDTDTGECDPTRSFKALWAEYLAQLARKG